MWPAGRWCVRPTTRAISIRCHRANSVPILECGGLTPLSDACGFPSGHGVRVEPRPAEKRRQAAALQNKDTAAAAQGLIVGFRPITRQWPAECSFRRAMPVTTTLSIPRAIPVEPRQTPRLPAVGKRPRANKDKACLPPAFSGEKEAVMHVAALIPAYREERFIGDVVRRARRHVPWVLVIDDGSDDGTAEAAQAAGAEVIIHPHNAGKGVALQTGLRDLVMRGYEYIMILDADGQHLPEEIPRFLDAATDGPRPARHRQPYAPHREYALESALDEQVHVLADQPALRPARAGQRNAASGSSTANSCRACWATIARAISSTRPRCWCSQVLERETRSARCP